MCVSPTYSSSFRFGFVIALKWRDDVPQTARIPLRSQRNANVEMSLIFILKDKNAKLNGIKYPIKALMIFSRSA